MARRYNPGLAGQISRLKIVDGTFSSIVTNEDMALEPSGTGDVLLITDTTRLGDQNGNAILTTWGTGDLTLNTNSGTNSGSIVIPDGANQSISISPNGSGDVRLNADTTRIGDQNGNATLTTWGSGDLTLNTNGGTNSGTITILDGAGQDIRIYPNGGGNIRLGQNTNSEVNLSSTTDSSTTTNGALTVPGGVGITKQLRVGGSATFSSTVTANFNPTSGGHLTRKTYTDTAAGLVWTAVSSNTTMVNLGNYFVDTSGGAITMTLPSSPSAGFRVRVVDSKNSFGDNTCTLGRNGQNIMGLAENMDLDVSDLCVELVWLNSTEGWKVTQFT